MQKKINGKNITKGEYIKWEKGKMTLLMEKFISIQSAADTGTWALW